MNDLAELTKQLTVFKNVSRGLYASWKTSVSELEKAVKGWKEATEHSVKEAAKAKSRAGKQTDAASGKKKKASSLMDVCLDKGVPVQSFDCRVSGWMKDSAEAVEILAGSGGMLMLPYLVSGVDISWSKDVGEGVSIVGASLQEPHYFIFRLGPCFTISQVS